MTAQASIITSEARERLGRPACRQALESFREALGLVGSESVSGVSLATLVDLKNNPQGTSAKREDAKRAMRRLCTAAGYRWADVEFDTMALVLRVAEDLHGMPGAEPEPQAEPEPEPQAEPEPAPEPAPEPEPEPEPSIASLVGPGAEPDAATALADAIRRIAGSASAPVDEGRVIELIRQHAGPRQTTTTHRIEIPQASGDPVVIEGAHPAVPRLVQALAAGRERVRRVNVLMVGPAGSGKTHAAEQAAEALSVPFYSIGAVDDAFSILGFRDARGEYQATAFRQAWEEGGLFLFDEMDGSAPEALLVVNQALANGCMAFPDGMVKRHPEFYCIAAANTYGHGADRQYVGRSQLDAATLDRFATMAFDYDATLERKLAGDTEQASRWCDYVQAVRQAARTSGARIIVSMRASIMGADLLAAGWSVEEVCESVLWKGCPADTRAQLESSAGKPTGV